jgi:hypothetical protein
MTLAVNDPVEIVPVSGHSRNRDIFMFRFGSDFGAARRIVACRMNGDRRNDAPVCPKRIPKNAVTA